MPAHESTGVADAELARKDELLAKSKKAIGILKGRVQALETEKAQRQSLTKKSAGAEATAAPDGATEELQRIKTAHEQLRGKAKSLVVEIKELKAANAELKATAGAVSEPTVAVEAMEAVEELNRLKAAHEQLRAKAKLLVADLKAANAKVKEAESNTEVCCTTPLTSSLPSVIPSVDVATMLWL